MVTDADWPPRASGGPLELRPWGSTTRVMQALVRASGIPVVFEIDSSHPDIEQDVDLMGRTVRQSLDLFTELNPSYSWREYDRVVVRETRTFNVDVSHFLKRRNERR